MNAQTEIAEFNPYRVGSKSLPPWDRSGGKAPDLTPLIGEYVATGPKAAARLLGSKWERIRSFLTDGILRDARIIERPFEDSATTFVCVTACYWSRLYLEPGERPIRIEFKDPAQWSWDSESRDAMGRVCVRVRPHQDSTCDDMTIVTDRRTYRIRLVGHDSKVTIGCSWTYPGGQAPATPAGEQGRWWGQRPGNVRPTRFIIFKLGSSLSDLVMEWAQTLEPRKTWQLRKYKAFRSLAQVPAEVPHPPLVISAVLKRLMEVGTISVAEIRQWLEVPGNTQELVDYFKELATGMRRNRLPLPSGCSPTPEDMLDPFPFLVGLPETCYSDKDTFAAATDRARAIVWLMGDLAPWGALFCAIGPRYLRVGTDVERTLYHLATLERIAKQAGMKLTLDDDDSVEAVATHLLDSPDCSYLSIITRSAMLFSLGLLIRTVHRYIRFKDPDNVKGLAALRPAELTKALLHRLNRLRITIGKDLRASRKRRVLQYAGRLSELDFSADLNLEQVVIATKALSSGAKDLGDSDWIDVPVPMTIVDHRGRLLPGKQVCTWRIWQPISYHRLLKSRTSDLYEIEWLDRKISELQTAALSGQTLEPIYEYRHTRGVAGSTPVEPFHVTCWRYGLIAAPARMPRRLRHKRHVILRQLKLPGCVTPRGELLAGTAAQMVVWRISLRQHRTIAYLDPFEHALRFAHFALSSVMENFCRTTAWLQQTQDQSGWEVRTLNGVKTAGFLAQDKQSGELREEMTWFPVGPKHQAEALELAAMTCRRCGYVDGLLPEIPQMEDLRWKRPDHQAWLFSYRGSVLSTSYLLRYLRFLLPGWGKVTYHDFRHLGANAAFEAGVPGWMIRLTLNHALTNLWQYYAQQSAAQNARFETAFLESRLERSAHARSSRAWAQQRFG
jgi:hypothetical protein